MKMRSSLTFLVLLIGFVLSGTASGQSLDACLKMPKVEGMFHSCVYEIEDPWVAIATRPESLMDDVGIDYDLAKFLDYDCKFKKRKNCQPSNLRYSSARLSNIAPAHDFAKISKSTARLTLLVRLPNGKQATTWCTGTIVDRHHVLTNHHCVFGKPGLQTWRLVSAKAWPRYISANQDSRTQYNLDVSDFALCEPFGANETCSNANPSDDYAILKSGSAFPTSAAPSSPWGYVTASDYNYGEALVISHPVSRPQQYDPYCRAERNPGSTGKFLHDCDTWQASSGALVFSLRDPSNVQIIGIHHTGGSAASTTGSLLDDLESGQSIKNGGTYFEHLVEDSPILQDIYGRRSPQPIPNPRPIINIDSSAQDQQLWDLTLIDDDIEAYKNYIKLMPGGDFVKDAFSRIENIDWALADSLGTISSYKNYLVEHPKGVYHTIAKYKIARAETRILQNITQTNNTDINLWKYAQREHSVKGYSLYIENYPKGRYYRQALHNITVINRESAPSSSNLCLGDLVFESIRYEFDKGQSQRTIDTLNRILNIAANCDIEKIEVIGHTDTAGSAAYNMSLSERRAKDARNELISQGIESNIITAEGRGETEPYVPVANGVKEKQNRRTDVLIYLRG